MASPPLPSTLITPTGGLKGASVHLDSYVTLRVIVHRVSNSMTTQTPRRVVSLLKFCVAVFSLVLPDGYLQGQIFKHVLQDAILSVKCDSFSPEIESKRESEEGA